MKLVSYVNDGVEWGIVITDAVSNTEYVIDPLKTKNFLSSYCSDRTVGYFSSRPEFLKHDLPMTMVEFLELGAHGMAIAREMKAFVERFVVQSDRTLLINAATALDKVKFLSPIPKPRLLWGLVGNSTSFGRGKWDVKQVQLVPQAHQRPLGTVIAHNQEVSLFRKSGGTPEFAIVIGKKCVNVKMEDAMQYVAGYTIVDDMHHSYYGKIVKELERQNGIAVLSEEEAGKVGRETGGYSREADIFAILSESWTGKYSDRMCGIGPWIVTPDEVGDPYDLLVVSKKDGEKTGRGHTGSLMVGVERAIAYYSSFATLYPGDIIHFGSASKDGFSFVSDVISSKCSMQCEIERVGTLNINATAHSEEHEASQPPVDRQIPDLTDDVTSLEFLNTTRLRNQYNVYGNSNSVNRGSNLKPKPFARFLCAPGTSSGTASAKTFIASEKIKASAEFCAVIGKNCRGIKQSEVAANVLGYCPMICLENYSLIEHFKTNTVAFARESGLPEIYGRWGDACNILSDNFIIPEKLSRDNQLILTAGDQRVEYNTLDYALWFDEVISYISTLITLYPGDIITLGNIGPHIDLSGFLVNNQPVTIKLQSNDLIITKQIALD